VGAVFVDILPALVHETVPGDPPFSLFYANKVVEVVIMNEWTICRDEEKGMEWTEWRYA
jgi:hypothetical protein